MLPTESDENLLGVLFDTWLLVILLLPHEITIALPSSSVCAHAFNVRASRSACTCFYLARDQADKHQEQGSPFTKRNPNPWPENNGKTAR